MDARPLVVAQFRRLAAEYLSGVNQFNDERAGRLVLAARQAGYLPTVELDNLPDDPKSLFRAVCRQHANLSPDELPDLWPAGPLTTSGEREWGRKCAAVCEWLAAAVEGGDGQDELLGRVLEGLTLQQMRLMEYLWTHETASYSALASIPKAFQGGPTDEAIERALKRTRQKLDQRPELQLTLCIETAKRRATLERLAGQN